HHVGQTKPPQGRRGPTIFLGGSDRRLPLLRQWPPKKIVTPTAASRPTSRVPDPASPARRACLCHSRQMRSFTMQTITTAAVDNAAYFAAVANAARRAHRSYFDQHVIEHAELGYLA